ncbi:O-antigen ligase family protein [Prochlorococcus marinus]|uniref:O-antigen ligase family protein n=1 Tax=Prochlorococcus marinus TaxID=1219 RepID=UPI0022B49FF6|nr:O-antigen ligase family protein [Prochlorococcus marinus]
MKNISFSKIFNLYQIDKIGLNCFHIGLLFLASSAFISAIFLLFSLIISSSHRFNVYLHDKWNYPLLIAAFLMVLGCFRAYSGWLAWIGLVNWIPFFWCFWGFQPYLLSVDNRRKASLLLLAGSVPVVVTGLGQVWLGWSGPWVALNGLIIWFVAPGGQPLGRLSGLFNYANITGAWLAFVWPIALAFLLQPSLNWVKRGVAFLFGMSICIALILTNSRNAWGGMVLSIPFVLGSATWFWLIPLLFTLLLPVVFAVLPIVPFELQLFARKIVPEGIWTRLADISLSSNGSRPLETTRIFQWKEAINLFFQKPWFGYGAAAFSIIYPLRQGIWHGHAHNLPLELVVAHGLPVAILLVSMILVLLIISFKKCFLTVYHDRQSVFDRAWWAATFTLVFLHASDMPMFDSRINLAGWIFLSGLRCLITPKAPKPSFDD